MGTVSEVLLAGRRTASDWRVARDELTIGLSGGWDKAVQDFFIARVELRYLEPIRTLQTKQRLSGEGFAIATIQCSIVEFLESTLQGVNYKFCRRGDALGKHEYSSSSDLFQAFLTRRSPFAAKFDKKSALDFYVSVRCGLLHEARTKNGWRILASSRNADFVDTERKILFRNNFQRALESYVATYAALVPHDPKLQEAFIRKFDSLAS